MSPERATSFVLHSQEAIADASCPMKYWYMSHEAGKGIVAKKDRLRDQILATTVDDLRTISRAPDAELLPGNLQIGIDSILNSLSDADRNNSDAMSFLFRRLGHLTAWTLFVEPDIRRLYTTIPIDDEILLDRDPLYLVMPSGRLLKNRMTGEYLYVSFVPASSTSYAWRASWRTHIQPQIELAAIKQAYPEAKIVSIQMKGFDLGTVSIATGAILFHPYVKGWYDPTTHVWSASNKTNYTTGLVERPVWEYPEGMVAWVKNAGAKIAEEQFPVSSTIFPNEKVLDAWTLNRASRARMIDATRIGCHQDASLRKKIFPMVATSCHPINGEPCTYTNACWNKAIQSPILSGEYEPVINLTHDEEEEEDEGTVVEGEVMM